MKQTLKERLIRLFIILLPGIIAFGTNCFAYMVPKLILSPDSYVYLDMEIDKMIPLIPEFIIIYYMSFAQWFNYFMQGCFGPKNLRNKYFSADVLAKIISFFLYLAWPLAMRWPQLPANGNIWVKLVGMAYGVDTPTGTFPSFHCFYSWMSLRYSFEREPKERRWICWGQTIFSFALFAATVLVKQHYFIDIIGGIAFAEIALQIAAHTKLADRFGDLMHRLSAHIEKLI